MKKFPTIVIICLLLPFVWMTVGGWYESPLKGKLKAVTVTMRYFSPAITNTDGLDIATKTVTIQQPDSVAAIQDSLSHVWNHSSVNSMEGFPKYHMEVEYTDGRKQIFVFTRTEWGGSGETPRSLLNQFAKNGLQPP